METVLTYLDRLIDLGHHPVVQRGVVAVLLFQVAAVFVLLAWTRATGSYEKGKRLEWRHLAPASVLRALASVPWHVGSAVIGTARGVVDDCRTIRWYCLKLVGGITGLVLVFGVFFDTAGIVVLDAAARFVLVLLAVFATRHTIFGLIIAFARMPWAKLEPSEYEPDVLVLIPCHNEETVVARLLDNLRALDYPPEKLRIVVINDASTDSTLEVANEYVARAREQDAVAPRPGVEVYHRPKGIGGKGKSAALNAAIERYGFGEIIAVFDADHKPDRDCLRRMVRHYADPVVGAFMGRCIPANKSDNIISYFVYLEYVVGYRGNMFAREVAQTVPAFGGSNCSVRRSLLLEKIGLFKEGCLAEDTELTMCVYEHGHVVRYDATARNYEEATDNLKTYIKQRTRWARGHDQVSLSHSWSTLTSPKMTWLRRLEGFLYLQVYWMPVLYLVGIAVTLVDFFVVPLYQFPYWTWVYFFFGPSLETVAAVARDREPVRTWLSLPLFPAFAALGMYIATKAAWQELMGKSAKWEKTARAADVTQGATVG